MAYIVWDSAFETGLRTIDEQHKKLIALINKLHEAMHHGKGREVVGSVLAELKDYTSYHFKTEERAFERYAYSRGPEHKRIHDDLISELDKIMEQYEAGSLLISVNLLEFLTKWVKDHIMKEDRKYIPELAGKEIAE